MLAARSPKPFQKPIRLHAAQKMPVNTAKIGDTSSPKVNESSRSRYFIVVEFSLYFGGCQAANVDISRNFGGRIC